MRRQNSHRISSKQNILDEIVRTAEANNGVPLGQGRFCRETGMKTSDWRGKFWVRWGDALRDAGYEPNLFQTAYDDEVLIEQFIGLMRDLGHYPLAMEVRMKARSDGSFPSHSTFARWGKQQFASEIIDYCNGRDGYADVAALCVPVIERLAELHHSEGSTEDLATDSIAGTKDGFVYMALLRLGREKRYKVGNAVLVERRTDQISIQLPADLELVHAIRTDDAYGIEDYWHRRFATKNTKGEWFSLSRQDIKAFKRRKFM